MTKKPTKEERDAKAKSSLYHCNICKLFLPEIEFGKNKGSRLGVAYRCRSCDRKRQTPPCQLTEERKRKAESGLYYCKYCEKYLPSQLFYKHIHGKFGLDPKCKLCRNPPKNGETIVRLKIPRSTKENIRRLSLQYDKTLQDTVIELITEGLKNAPT